MSLTSEKWASGINVLAGLWFIVVPFWFGSATNQLWSGVISGIVVAVLGAYDYWLESRGEPANSGAAGIAALFGLWMIVSPFVFPAGTALLWSDVVGGIIVAVLGGYNVYDAGQTGEMSPNQSAGA